MFKITPLTQRRIANFKSNKRGWWSLWLFGIILVICLLANFVANDKPLLIKYHDQFYTPIFKYYPETVFGGDFDVAADYTDPYIQELILQNGWMIWPPIRFSYNTIDYDLDVPAPAPPSAKHWLGTDDQARDVVARIIYGLRVSILFGLSLTIISSVIGILAGAIQGYFGGRLDLIAQRFIEIWEGLPVLYLLIIMSSIITPGFFSLLGIMLLFAWTGLVAVVRAEFLKARNYDYIRAAKALGVRDLTIMWRHTLPNAMVAILTFLPFILTGAITSLTSLDFLGLGLPAGSASLGEMLNQGKNNINSPWLGFSAFFTLAILLSLLVFIGEAVRDAFDPHKSGVR